MSGVQRPWLTRAGLLGLVVAISVIALDQAAKYWILVDLDMVPGETRPLFWPLALTFVRNDGVSFGFFQTHAEWTRWALAAFSFVASVGLVAWGRNTHKLVTGLATGLILGGALGNLIDRVRLGAVVDFVDVHPLFFPWIFNVADSGITLGVIVLLAEAALAGRRATG